MDAYEAVLLLFVADHALRHIGFRRLVRTLIPGGSRVADAGAVTRVTSAIAARRKRIRHSCLREGFAAAWMLRRRGFNPVLHYGVRRDAGEMQAHVWVEVNGHPVVGSEQAIGYTLLASFPVQGDRTPRNPVA